MKAGHGDQVRRVLEASRLFADSYVQSPGPVTARDLVVLTCMDTRIDVLQAFGLRLGDAQILRNAGGVVTDDVLRSLCVSQRFLETRDVLVVQHTGCGLYGVSDEELTSELEAEKGSRPPWTFLGFDDIYDSVRSSLERLRQCKFLEESRRASGFVFDTATGHLTLVDPD